MPNETQEIATNTPIRVDYLNFQDGNLFQIGVTSEEYQNIISEINTLKQQVTALQYIINNYDSGVY